MKKQILNQTDLHEQLRDFVKDMDSGGNRIQGVTRGKFKAKRGRKPKKKVNHLDGGDLISDSQIMSCNKQIERRTCREEAMNNMLLGVEMGLIDNQKVIKWGKFFKNGRIEIEA